MFLCRGLLVIHLAAHTFGCTWPFSQRTHPPKTSPRRQLTSPRGVSLPSCRHRAAASPKRFCSSLTGSWPRRHRDESRHPPHQVSIVRALQATPDISARANPGDDNTARCRSILRTRAFDAVSDASPPPCFVTARPSPPPHRVAPLRRARRLSLSGPLPSSTLAPTRRGRCSPRCRLLQPGSAGPLRRDLSAASVSPCAPQELIAPRDTPFFPHRSEDLWDQSRLQRAAPPLDES